MTGNQQFFLFLWQWSEHLFNVQLLFNSFPYQIRFVLKSACPCFHEVFAYQTLRRRMLYPAELRRHSLIFGLNTGFSASRSDNRFYGNSHFLWLVTNNFFCFFDSEANTFLMFNSCSIRFRTRSDLYSNLPVPASMRCSLTKHLGGPCFIR